MRLATFASLCLLALTSPAVAVRKSKDAILLSQVKSLTLRGHGAKTTNRRVAAVPQLRCISPRSICNLFEVDVMRCENKGSSYGEEDVEWLCTASLPETLRLGSTDVICEGYASSDDKHVLKGSCGVEYRLVLTDEGERRHPDLARGGSWFGDGGAGETDWSARLFSVVFIALALWILYSACFAANRGGAARPRRRRGGPGGGGWGPGGGGGGGWNPSWGPGDDPDDPPPPYPGMKPSSSTRQAQGWAPGFWSGLAGGAAAGYMAGNRGRDRNEGGGQRRFFGGGGGGGSSGASFSSARHESSGFGSTSRR